VVVLWFVLSRLRSLYSFSPWWGLALLTLGAIVVLYLRLIIFSNRTRLKAAVGFWRLSSRATCCILLPL